jgi:hypothetical protein
MRLAASPYTKSLRPAQTAANAPVSMVSTKKKPGGMPADFNQIAGFQVQRPICSGWVLG